jgi:proline dehydrogenase
MRILDRLITVSLPLVPRWLVGKIASRYIAGETMEDAIRTVKQLNRDGFKTTLDVLGEFVEKREEAEKYGAIYMDLLNAIQREKLDSGISVKLTAVGMQIDREYAKQNFTRLLDAAAERNIFVRIDMEDSPYTTDTLGFYSSLRGGKKLGVVVQAYMRRTEQDVRDLIAAGKSDFRLCKGIYVEPVEIAYRDREEVRRNFLKVLDVMLEKKALVGIATHDEYLVIESEKLLKKHGTPSAQYEFQMLLGVCPELRKQIKSRGHRVRVYVPFGEAWYGYCTRRLKENPAIAGYVFKSLFRKL